MKTKTQPKPTYVPVNHTETAVVPVGFLAPLKVFSFRSLACNRHSGALFSSGEHLTGDVVGSRLMLHIGGPMESVSRISALILFQVGGRALVGPSKNYGGYLATLSLPVGRVVEVR